MIYDPKLPLKFNDCYDHSSFLSCSVDYFFYNYHEVFILFSPIIYFCFILFSLGKKSYALYFSILFPFSFYIFPLFFYFCYFILIRFSVLFFDREFLLKFFLLLVAASLKTVFFYFFPKFNKFIRLANLLLIFICFPILLFIFLPILLFILTFIIFICIFFALAPYSFISLFLLILHLREIIYNPSSPSLVKKDFFYCFSIILLYVLWNKIILNNVNPYDVFVL